jgi:bile acid-coenzyme A ligase
MGDLPAYHAGRGGGTALIHGGESVSWGELHRRATRRAWGLKAAGVKANDFVTLALPNGAAFFELTFALWKLGATPHVVCAQLPQVELTPLLDVVRPRLVISADQDLRAKLGAKPCDFGLDSGTDRAMASSVASSWKAMSSGGSTGRPKVIVDRAPGTYDPEVVELGMPAGAAVLNTGPLSHNAPFISTHLALFRGSTVVGMTRFDAQSALLLIERHRIAWVNFVPTMMHRIWRLPREVRLRYDLSSLEAVWHMAAPMPAWLKAGWIEWLGPERIFELYGGTERQGYTVITGTEWLAHRGSVGHPVSCDIRILHEQGRPMQAREIGEIYLRPDSGARTTYHYLGAEARAAGEGFESLGDFGWLDEDGYLYIADRRTDLIVTGGANVYPAEVESALLEHPGVDFAVVIGLPDEDLGARVHALVTPAEGTVLRSGELAGFLRGRLARYKIPRSFELTREPLRDEAGKVRRSELRAARVAARSDAANPASSS